MKILEDIRLSILDNSNSLADILRKTLIFAYKSKNEKIIRWVESELNGYPNNETEIPKYRIVHTDSYGNYIDIFKNQLNNVGIPMLSIPESLRSHFDTLYMKQSISELEELLKTDSYTYKTLWTPDQTAIYNNAVKNINLCTQAWYLFSRGHFVSLLERIRNCLLKFILELEDEYSNLPENDYDKVSPKKVETIFNNCIIIVNTTNNGVIIGDRNEFSGETNIENTEE
jgi:hypothetical protein